MRRYDAVCHLVAGVGLDAMAPDLSERLLAGDPAAVRRAYASAMMRDHPDHGGTGANLARLKEARDTLLLEHDAIPSCKLCKGVGKIRGRFGAQTCTACEGSGDQR